MSGLRGGLKANGTNLPIDSRGVRTKGVQQILDEVGEVLLAETLDEGAKGFRGGTTSLWDGINQDLVHERHVRLN